MPRGTWPRKIAFDDRGSMWITESSADAIAERRPDGRIVQHRLGEATETSVDDIVRGPDGNMWFQGFQVVGWVTPSGEVGGFELGDGPDIGLPSAMTRGPNGNVWFTSDGVEPAIRRVTAKRAIRVYPLPGGEGGLTFSGITAGRDGALWFVQKADDPEIAPEAVGRLEVDGRYMRIPIPHDVAGANRIAAGPDKAVWFTQSSRHSIGRLTQTGKYREFKLKPGTAPFDIVSGSDGALWFTTQKSIGRITTAGAIRTWPIRGAKDLAGLAEAPNGSFWITDPSADRVHHFVPPKP